MFHRSMPIGIGLTWPITLHGGSNMGIGNFRSVEKKLLLVGKNIGEAFPPHTHTHTRTRTRAHARAHTHTHTHTHRERERERVMLMPTG
jgi:hypothetical protein